MEAKRKNRSPRSMIKTKVFVLVSHIPNFEFLGVGVGNLDLEVNGSGKVRSMVDGKGKAAYNSLFGNGALRLDVWLLVT